MVENSKTIEFVRDLRRSYAAAVNEVDMRFTTKSEIIQIAILKPADSFYMSIEEVRRVINSMEKGDIDCRKSLTALKYNDLFEVYTEIRNSLPYLPREMAIEMTSTAPAPRFYISSGWGRKVLNKYISV